jgi:stearoyl-CoA desaturase (delta-9 desaturase)
LAIAIFFVVHWQLSVFLQSFFLHRYGAHRQFTMSKGWERFFHALTWLAQGSTYLNPRVYAILHRMHHAYSDTPQDPHSPVVEPNVLRMMLRTEKMYRGIKAGRVPVDPRFEGGHPDWPFVDRTLGGWPRRLFFAALYTLFYVRFATAPWQFALIPLHLYMGPMHGAIVNWGGHRLGYRNFDDGDASRNTLPFDFLTMGELFQNNHHRDAMRPDFAVRWFEIDPAWQVMRLFHRLGIIAIASPEPNPSTLPTRWSTET